MTCTSITFVEGSGKQEIPALSNSACKRGRSNLKTLNLARSQLEKKARIDLIRLRKTGLLATVSLVIPWTAVAIGGMGTRGLMSCSFSIDVPSGRNLTAAILTIRSV